jgi:hypothetical protein
VGSKGTKIQRIIVPVRSFSESNQFLSEDCLAESSARLVKNTLIPEVKLTCSIQALQPVALDPVSSTMGSSALFVTGVWSV